jgi:hypothetical protein
MQLDCIIEDYEFGRWTSARLLRLNYNSDPIVPKYFYAPQQVVKNTAMEGLSITVIPS